MESLKTRWDLLQALIENRWARYVVGVVFLALGLLLGAQTLMGMRVCTASGTIRSVEVQTDSSTGKYAQTLITLTGGTTRYAVQVGYFSPTLAADGLSVGERVNLWYERPPLFDPDVIALQSYAASGAPTKYVTSAYTDPVGARRGNLIATATFLALGLLTLAAGRWLPTASEVDAAGKSTKKPTYGQTVVGPPRQPK